jgi:serine/threonine protein kinase
MPAPTTGAELLELMRKSSVVEEKQLARYLTDDGKVPFDNEPGKLAALLVRDRVLTKFQAEQFLQGRWRRFTIGKYKVLDRIGIGGMGSVYLCEHKFMRRLAAVKVLPVARAQDPSALERFYREARAVAALDHPNIVRAYDIDQEDGLHFLVMEYVEGSSLQEIVRRDGPLEAARSARYISQAALGLQHAHEVAAIVHRDIKPGNLIVDRAGTVKVLDMGLARFFNDENDVLTRKYDENVLGTADYLAPEQVLDSHGVDIRADIYSLGATFYFCLTARTPFGDGTTAQKLIWHQTRRPKPVRSFRSDVPEGLIAVLEKMMAKDVLERYQTPAEVVGALAPWVEGSAGMAAGIAQERNAAAMEPDKFGGSHSPSAGPPPQSGLSVRPLSWKISGNAATAQEENGGPFGLGEEPVPAKSPNSERTEVGLTGDTIILRSDSRASSISKNLDTFSVCPQLNQEPDNVTWGALTTDASVPNREDGAANSLIRVPMRRRARPLVAGKAQLLARAIRILGYSALAVVFLALLVVLFFLPSWIWFFVHSR